MVHSSSVWRRLVPLLLVAILTPGRLRIRLFRTILRQMPFLATEIALIGGVRGTVLHRGIIGIPLLLLWALSIVLLGALIASLLLVLGMLLVLITVPLARRSLVPLLIAWLRVRTGVVVAS